MRGFVHPSVRRSIHRSVGRSVRPSVRPSVHGHESKSAKMSVLNGFWVCVGGMAYGWGLDAPAHPSATILLPRVTCYILSQGHQRYHRCFYFRRKPPIIQRRIFFALEPRAKTIFLSEFRLSKSISGIELLSEI